MNFDDAIQKHAEWRMKFRTAMSMKQKVDASAIGKDNCCELGKWLYAEGKTLHGRLASYNQCIEAHKGFHVEAGRVAVLINDGKCSEAEKHLAAGSAYSRASTSIAGALMKLKSESAKAA